MIGNREEMQMYGAQLFKTLLKGYLSLKETGMVMSSLQPSNIYISQDAKKVQFTDLISMTKEGIEAKHPVRGS